VVIEDELDVDGIDIMVHESMSDDKGTTLALDR
jgi:hypothetical protein